MAKGIRDASLDVTLDDIATCTRLDITSDVTAPTDLTNSLANVTLTAGDGNGDYTITDDATNGRRLTVTAQSGVATTSAGTPAHAVLSLGGTIYAYTSLTGDALTFPGTANISEFYIRLADPT